MNPRWTTLAAIALLAAAVLAVRQGKLDEGRDLESIAALWGDLFRDASRTASAPLHVSADRETQLGAQLSANLRAAYATDAEHQPSVLRVGQRLAAFAQSPVPFTFLAIEDPSLNAFALPGGHVFITRGLADFVRNDDELAAVLGHEMAHVELRHCLDGHRYEAVLGRLGAAGAGELMDAMQRSLSIAYSREQEFDADARGVVLASQAGYNPQVAAGVFRRIAVTEAPAPGGWFAPYAQSHPGAMERAARFERQVQSQRPQFR